ncbi:cytochrome C oxidase subunit II [Anopheles sinensis]|uniref:Cytochrome C oxidase subunit II n=1 Tax=Anopheles sinensis TaxID=74873 RepID=A0A084W8S4_ANOSI|nr:cytochrome C oxidase subunit II [Anopheles sinensis]
MAQKGFPSPDGVGKRTSNCNRIKPSSDCGPVVLATPDRIGAFLYAPEMGFSTKAKAD